MRRLQSAILVVLVLLMPLRGMAGATMGIAQPEAQQHDMQADSDCNHEHAPQPDSDHGCDTCAEHGCCGAFLTSIAGDVLPAFAAAARITLGQRLIAGYVPEHLDPPPLAV